jgi:predicted nuclease of predicted toxin-antitoxin system
MGAHAGSQSGRSRVAGFVKLLLDEMLTPRLAPLLTGHDVSHVTDLGWRHITNGELLTLAESYGFDALITKDSQIPYQQNLGGRNISIVIIAPKDQTRPTVLAMAPHVLLALPTLKPGSVIRVAHD